MRSLSLLTCSLPVLGLAACVDTVAPPEPTPQVDVAYGATVWVKDITIGRRPARQCLLLGAIVAPNGAQTSTTVGGEVWMDDRDAVNCNVRLANPDAERTIAVDVLEVTNRLFQLCVDSGICRRPDPADVDKIPVCRAEASFDDCPVVAVTLDEATRFCEFVGRRLPSGFEHILMRQGNVPTGPEQARNWPFETDAAPTSCDGAVLKTCDVQKPYPSSTTPTVVGAGRLDKSPQGVFDLSGNVVEWTTDQMPTIRGDELAELPWFCNGVVTGTECPRGAACVFGRFRHPTTGTIGEYPVCLTDPDLRFTNGTIGVTWGGSFSSDTGADAAGVFARREKPDPTRAPGDAAIGLRCVGRAGQSGSGAPRAALTE